MRRDLYLWTGNALRCRVCEGLVYPIECLTPRKRAAWRRDKIARRIIPQWDVSSYPPERPKGMHRKRYDQLLAVMPFVGAKGWLVLSRNYRQRYEPAERDVAMRAGLALFYLRGKGTHEELGANLVRTLPKVIAFREAHEPPFIAHIVKPAPREPGGSPGTVKMMLSHAAWRERFASDE